MSMRTGMKFVEPRVVVSALPVRPGDIVADFGAGSGHFSCEFGRAVGSEGRVYALDVLPSALEAITSQAKTLGLTNVVAQRCNLERANGSGLGNASVDWVIAKDVLMQNQDKGIIMHEVARILKPSGRALIVEWDPNAATVGPDRELRITADAMRTLVTEAGMSVVEEPEVGGFHYALLVEKHVGL